jgi:transcriptional regulator with XRE-family HTH domain
MAVDELRRAGEAVETRMKELGLTVPQLAKKAGISPATVRSFIRGERRLHDDTIERLVAALDWAPGEISRRVWGGWITLADASTVDLVRELCRRLTPSDCDNGRGHVHGN